jgi:hypothetical protein
MARKKAKSATLTLQFIPYGDIESLKSPERVNKLLQIVKKNKIILLEGKLRSQEEAELIRRTMEEIDDKFKGIEISPVIIDSKNDAFVRKIKETLINLLLGDRRGFTIIGPASVVKEIKQDPEKIQLLTEDLSK